MCTAATHSDARDLVNTAAYPIYADHESLLGEHRRRFQADGFCLLPEFVTGPAAAAMASEANALAHKAHFSSSSHDIYLAPPEDGTPSGRTSVGSIPNDAFGLESELQRLYNDDTFCDFLSSVIFGKPAKLHRLADEIGACTVNVYNEGDAHFWHFDESAYSVTLMLQTSEEGGGEFFAVPNARSGWDDGAGALPGVEDAVGRDELEGEHLVFEEGTLSIFGGWRTLHRVTPVRAGRRRLVAVMCFSEVPNTRNSDDVRMRFWGRK